MQEISKATNLIGNLLHRMRGVGVAASSTLVLIMAGTLASTLAGALVPTTATAFQFAGLCDDCAFLGSPGDPGFDPFGDGLFETVTGTLNLNDVTLNASGNIDISSNNFDSFEYSGSSLLNPFVLADPFIIDGEITPTGELVAGTSLRIETSFGDFSNFCTELGEQVIDNTDCSFVDFALFELDSDGNWSISGTVAFDIGVGGQLNPIPEPGTALLLGLGLLGLTLRPNRRASPI